MNKTLKYKGLLAAFGALFSFSIIEVVGSLVYRGGASLLTLLTIRCLLASFLFFITLLIMGKKLFRVERKDIGKLLLHSTILITHLLFFWEGIKALAHVPTALALFHTFPLWIAFLSVLFLREKFNRTRVLSVALGMVGTLFAVRFLPYFSLGMVNIKGAVLMLIGAILWAFYTIFGRELLKKYNAFTILFYNFSISFLIFLTLQSPKTLIGEITPSALVYLLVLGVVSTYLAYLFYYKALRYIKASNVGIIAFLKPVIGSGLAFLLLSQVVTAFQALGMALIIVGVILLYRQKEKI